MSLSKDTKKIVRTYEDEYCVEHEFEDGTIVAWGKDIEDELWELVKGKLTEEDLEGLIDE